MPHKNCIRVKKIENTMSLLIVLCYNGSYLFDLIGGI